MKEPEATIDLQQITVLSKCSERVKDILTREGFEVSGTAGMDEWDLYEYDRKKLSKEHLLFTIKSVYEEVILGRKFLD